MFHRDPKGWIQTFTGKQFWPCDPRPEDVDIDDIAHHLAVLTRFTGATREPYSIAQHCCLVANNVPPRDKLWGLMHDAAEAYLGDLASPTKRNPALSGFRLMEDKILDAVTIRFGLSGGIPPSVHYADRRALLAERRDLLSYRADWSPWEGIEPFPDTVKPWPWHEAETTFKDMFYALQEN